MNYDYYDESIKKYVVITNAIEWLNELADKLKKDGLIGYSLSVKQYADNMARGL